MKAVVRDTYGTSDVLRVEDVPVPVVNDDDVLIAVHATSINDYDWHLLTGSPFVNRVGAPFRPQHRILGSDVAGTVTAVGRAVTRYSPGDAVYGDMSTCGFGAFAELVSAPQTCVAPKPASLTFEQAAAVPQVGGLALTGLRGRRPIGAGERVLVNGAGGGVGTIAVQVAKAAGAEVTAVDAAHKLGVLHDLGADHVLDYALVDVLTSGRTFDRIIDMACHHSIGAYRRCLAPGGYCGLIGGSVPRIIGAMAAGPLRSAFSDRRVGVPFWKPNDPADVATLGALLESGQVVPVIDSVRPLERLAEAFDRFGAQQHTGKLVIRL